MSTTVTITVDGADTGAGHQDAGAGPAPAALTEDAAAAENTVAVDASAGPAPTLQPVEGDLEADGTETGDPGPAPDLAVEELDSAAGDDESGPAPAEEPE